MHLQFDLLTPGEVSEISGVSLDNQRNLRRAGYLPKMKGHARFTLLDTARLMVIGLLSERGIGPKVAVTFADTAARGIVLGVFRQSRLYSDEVARAALAETRDEADDDLALTRESLPDLDEAVEKRVRGIIALQLLSELLEKQLGMRGEKSPNLFVLWANGHAEFFYGDDDPWSDVMYDHPAWQGPIIVLPMPAIASLLASRLPRPIVRLAEIGAA